MFGGHTALVRSVTWGCDSWSTTHDSGQVWEAVDNNSPLETLTKAYIYTFRVKLLVTRPSKADKWLLIEPKWKRRLGPP